MSKGRLLHKMWQELLGRLKMEVSCWSDSATSNPAPISLAMSVVPVRGDIPKCGCSIETLAKTEWWAY